MSMLLQIDGLRKAHGSVTVLDGVSLSLDRGQTVALTGESGSGKKHAAAPRRRARYRRYRVDPHRRDRGHHPRRRGPCRAPARGDRPRLPAVQPDPLADRCAEHRLSGAAGGPSRPSPRRRACPAPRPCRSGRALPRAAVGGAAATRRHRPRAGPPARADPCRRAHRQPRRGDGRRGSRSAPVACGRDRRRRASDGSPIRPVWLHGSTAPAPVAGGAWATRSQAALTCLYTRRFSTLFSPLAPPPRPSL